MGGQLDKIQYTVNSSAIRGECNVVRYKERNNKYAINIFSMHKFVQVRQSAKATDKSANKYVNSPPKSVNFSVFL